MLLVVQVDRRSITNAEDKLFLMRDNNHFMYIKDMIQIRYCYKCKKCTKIVIISKHATAMK